MSKSAQTVYVVDDDTSFLSSMTRWLRSNGYAVESYSSAADFLARRPKQAPGCVVADLQMPGMNGLELQTALAQSKDPQPIVFLTGCGDIPTSVTTMRRGAVDFLLKTAPKEELVAAIERALARDAHERGARLRHHELLIRFEQLTRRENEILKHVLHGRLNKQIAADLGINERSVKRHRSSLMHKLEVKSVAELAQLAVMAGVTDEMKLPSDVLI